jgi:hypothetical protein
MTSLKKEQYYETEGETVFSANLGSSLNEPPGVQIAAAAWWMP